MQFIRWSILILVSLTAVSAFAQSLPGDAQPTCTVAPAQFNSWFRSGSVSVNGAVQPANSLTFDRQANCSFYRWSYQMFLWLTSPSKGLGGGRVFNSAPFYDVSPERNGVRVFLPHLTKGEAPIQSLSLRPAKPGPNGFPSVVDRAGRLIEVAPGNDVRITIGADRRAVFQDAGGKTIPAPAHPAGIAQRFYTVDGVPVIVRADGTVADVDPAQALGNAVLLAQNNAIVYYSVAVNDVYAYFLTGVKNGAINTGNQFPTTQSDLDQIVAYGAKFGKKFADPQALAIEIKASWIEAKNLPNPGNYITMLATVPTYDRSNSKSWTPTGTKKTVLALLGLHVVGSTIGHPEMLWATFEHFGNTPNATYTYYAPGNTLRLVNQDTSGTWLFTQSGAQGNFNVARADYNHPPNITATNNNTIGPSNTLRAKPFGTAFAQNPPNPVDANSTASNTEVISINNSVLRQLPVGDIRKNYFFLGTTWTDGGAPPSGPYPTGNEIGTNYLANSTMETYHQGTDNTTASSMNCLTCHTASPGSKVADTAVSHIFKRLQPLPKP